MQATDMGNNNIHLELTKASLYGLLAMYSTKNIFTMR